jgi:mRNA m6A methyltransferase catalytic subunit
MSQRGTFSFDPSDNSYGNENDVQSLKNRRIPQPAPIEPTLEALLNYQTFKQREAAEREEILETTLAPTTMQNLALDRARAQHVQEHGYAPYRHYCLHKTYVQCLRASPVEGHHCEKVHFKPILRPHTDVSLGDCSYLNTCHRMLDSCKYVHYEVDVATSGSGDPVEEALMQDWLVDMPGLQTGIWTGEPCVNLGELPSQWISCDVRRLDLRILGKFGVLMMDPPWDIHMTLPYGTLTDDEMKDLKISQLQDDGILLLWVTGRAMEVGRECLARWGYNRIDELVWVKTNQLQRLIRYVQEVHFLTLVLVVLDIGSIIRRSMC